MNSKLYLSLISTGTYCTRACLNSIFLWTLALSVFIVYPSFANNNHLKNTAETATNSLSTTMNTAAFADIFFMPKDSQAITVTIKDCDAQNKFMDDGDAINFPLYEDLTGMPRNDTIAICPTTPWQMVNITFKEFDVAVGDTLMAYDGDLTALKNNTAPLLGKSSGAGVSKAFGGWVAANCSPNVNPSGCLSFIFTTNGDYAKGIGWNSWVSCNDRGIVVTPPSIQNARLDCDETMATLTIGAATIATDCGAITDDSTIVRISNTAGTVCVDTCLSKHRNMVITDKFAIGTYLVNYKLKGDTTKSALTYFTVSAPNLTCNDDVRIPFGSACAISIRPDMVLENTCDTIQDTLYYQIKIIDGAGKILAAGTGRNGDYPMLTRDQIPSCSSNLSVEVTRVYYDGLDLPFCNNGRQSSTCSTNVLFFDNSPPIFTESASSDTIYACDPILTEAGLMVTQPTAIDNCGDVNITFQGTSKINSVRDDCDATTYIVTWLAADNCNNTATLKDTVSVLRPGIDKIVKVADATLSCGEDGTSTVEDLNKTGRPGLMVGLQRNGVFTPTDTVELNTKTYVCSYILTKRDIQVPSTCGTKLFRYWTIVDWCGNIGPMPIDTQAILFTDTLAPTIQCSAFNTLANAEKINLPNFNCTKTVAFPTPTATDNCDLLPEVEMFTVETLSGNTWQKLGNTLGQTGALGLGTYRVGFRAFDQCFTQVKEDTCYRYFILDDATKPSAVCQDELTVSLSNDVSRIRAVDIDGGSWDACGIENILVRRQVCGLSDVWEGSVNTYVRDRLNGNIDPIGWADFVDFSCCDLDKNVMVELLAIDKNGNYNFCWMEVIATDKIDPICVDLPNQWDYCDNFHNGELGAPTDTDGDQQFDNTEWVDLTGDLADLYNEKYGVPFSVCVDNLSCQDLTIEQQYQLIDLECGVYKGKRRYRARDQKGNVSAWAEQFINIEYRPDWTITFPVDWSGTCGDGVPEAADIILENGSCDLLAYESTDQQFDVVNDACFKVIRTYYVINWCKYKPGDQPISINRISNSKGDVVNSQTISSAQYGTASYFTYTQILKVEDTDAPAVSVASVDDCISGTTGCSATKTFSATGTDCNDASSESLVFSWEIFENNVIQGSGIGATFDWTVEPGINYTVKWSVADRCGNSTGVENDYTFRDCVRPSPYCLAGLTLELGDNKEVEIWASDYDLNSSDNCTPKDKLDLRIWHPSLSDEAPSDLAGVLALPSNVNFSCDYIGAQAIYIYVIDEAGNYDFCLTTTIVQDNQGVCPLTGGSISGKIYTEFGSAVQDVEVHIENLDNEMMMTPSNGNYVFNVNGSANYTVVPSKNNGVLNGISTFDLVKITKHILGQEIFASPYQYIAADVNASGEVSTFDIIQLRKLILNLSTEFPNDNTSWRFVAADYDFTTDNPSAEEFPERIEVNGLTGTLPDLDFIAVKVGDINGSASASALSAEDRTKEGNLQIEVADRLVTAGEVIEVAFDAREFENIEGYQFTLKYTDLELMDIMDGVATKANFGFALQDRGYLVTSWHNAAATKNVDNANLFRLQFKVNKSGNLLSFLAINGDFTESEAYQNDGALLAVALQAKANTTLSSTFKVAQNTPNPFTNSTFIGFELPTAAAIELNILDMQGQIIQTKKGNFEKGQQQIEVRANELSNGTYYYQLVTPFGIAAKKMIVLK